VHLLLRLIPPRVRTDPVGAGFVDSLSQPGGTATGFTPFEYSTSGQWLELLKEIAPRVTRVAVISTYTAASLLPIASSIILK
jgi:ABC-type uncharacterized transport system substrate-binding protein